MASFDIKSELDHHEVTNAVDQAIEFYKIDLTLRVLGQSLT